MGLKIIIFSLFLLTTLSSCGALGYKKSSSEIPQNAQERARKNVKEGRGVSIGGMLNRGGNTNYEFSTSNPMWRATLETLDFLPLANVDYSGGVVITDWYSDESSGEESIKISLRFLANDIRSESLKVIVHKKTCNQNANCKTLVSQSNLIKDELRTVILKKAALLQKSDKEKK